MCVRIIHVITIVIIFFYQTPNWYWHIYWHTPLATACPMPSHISHFSKVYETKSLCRLTYSDLIYISSCGKKLQLPHLCHNATATQYPHWKLFSCSNCPYIYKIDAVFFEEQFSLTFWKLFSYVQWHCINSRWKYYEGWNKDRL